MKNLRLLSSNYTSQITEKFKVHLVHSTNLYFDASLIFNIDIWQGNMPGASSCSTIQAVLHKIEDTTVVELRDVEITLHDTCPHELVHHAHADPLGADFGFSPS